MPRILRILAGGLSAASTLSSTVTAKRLPSAANFARTTLCASCCCLLGAVFMLPQLLAAQNPIPLVNQPLIPASVAPGGPGFTLTVRGTGFVPGARVRWNGAPRPTAFVSSSEVTATIRASDIAFSTAASITVSNPSSGTSNPVNFPVTDPISSVTFTISSLSTAGTDQWHHCWRLQW